jgi:hypothetical protein
MNNHVMAQIPVVAIYNNLETFYPFLHRADDRTFFEKRKYRGDLSLFWLGRSKLVFATTSVPPESSVWAEWGYNETELLAPDRPTHQLSLDILREPRLVNRIVEYAGSKKAVQLVPYATTAEFLELAEKLQREYGLTVLLPESPSRENLWLRNYIDTKSGFRQLISQWIDDAQSLPLGVVCGQIEQAAEVVAWFNRQGKNCVVKADRGESGLGHRIFNGRRLSKQDILKELQANPFLHDDMILVEERIRSSAELSPSLELFVPPLGQGAPEITYLSNQLFERFGSFVGVLISRDLTLSSWYPALAQSGLKIASHLQSMGYVGHFDLDAVVDDAGQLYLLELNARRTGGTYVHEFARFAFGPNYLDRIALLCSNPISSGTIRDVETLRSVIGDLWFRNGNDTGIVVTVTSTLQMGEFGCILTAPDEIGVLALKQELLDRIETYQFGARFVEPQVQTPS